MKLKSNISEAEWHIMKVLWKQSPATAKEIVAELGSKTNWKPKTILTLINRLVKKGGLDYSKKGREFHYYPTVTEETCKKSESQSFIHRVYDGAFKPMLAHFINESELSEQDINEFKNILDQKHAINK